MAVIFESKVILNKARDGWAIELKDTVDERVVICNDMKEYQEQIKELGDDYGGNIDKVNWSKDDDVPPHFMDEIRQEMANIQAEIEEQMGEKLIKDEDKK
ncbi:hypothetical protein FJR48_08365 [Sulfurimonas lithotrophica]|uniref:Uncharacterized protein n=1 Tax=Sulfurimonas lithotrophica TaxID=2590022 RepID=A0A5P8P236_9BACT|nr:hypothetical protein [Sulfurimonas lithotrophica]QFR49744.1 hypothetical protein FJR48_08365 [Sulfurimonas lithotrophica]